jgi:hypothetical protein
MLVVTNCYIIFGIALLSMCLNLMQEQIIDGVSDVHFHLLIFSVGSFEGEKLF